MKYDKVFNNLHQRSLAMPVDAMLLSRLANLSPQGTPPILALSFLNVIELTYCVDAERVLPQAKDPLTANQLQLNMDPLTAHQLQFNFRRAQRLSMTG